ncbi:MAG: hypothetical protein ACOX0R_00145 [Candidatus Dojkabacteria bacterium]|jgi:DNA-directed RNA polymerase specialized sigma subunit
MTPVSFRGEYNIAQKIKDLLKKDKQYEPTKEDIAEQVDQEILEYWIKRAKESKNPILSSRYVDLVVCC